MADKAAEKEINKIRRLPENKVCPNCGKEAQNWGFTAVVVPFSIFVCDDCKSAHQSFSHRCKSATMSNWTMDEVRKLMEQNSGGNKACIAKWLINLEPDDRRKPQPDSHIDKKKDFVNMAYNQKLWLGNGSDSRRGDRGRDDSPDPPPRRRGDRGRDDSPDPPPRRRGDRGRDNDPPARMAPPNGGRQAAAPSMDLFDTDAPSTGSVLAPGGGFDASGGFNPNGSGSLFDPNPPSAASGGGFNPNAGSSSGSLFDPNPPAVSGGGGGFNPNAGSTSFDPFMSGAPASQPSPTGGCNPNAGAQQAAAPPATSSAGGFDDFGFDSFQAAPAAPAGQAAGGVFNPNGPTPAQGGGFNPNGGFNPSAAAPAGGVGGCGSPAGANTAAALWGNAGGAGGMPCMGGCGCVGAMPAAGGDRFAALGGGYSQMQMQQQAPWPQQQPAAFGAPAAMGQQPNNRFAALGAPSGPQMMAAAGFQQQQQQMRGPAGCGGCGGQAFGMQPGGMPSALQQGGFNPSSPTMGSGNVQDLQRSLNNLYDGSGGQRGKGPAGGGQAQGAFGAFGAF